ncbi:TPA: hypothetical protein ENX78_13450 [Candidatus Poribacteria bacterium]|nr:hypothetical protein [Candidatus Poribacteria bacterium]
MQRLLLIITIFLVIISGCAKQELKDITPLTKSIADKPVSVDEIVNIISFSENEIANWKLLSPVKIYDKKTIFDYIDGAAEIYFAYDFVRVATAEYKKGDVSILIDAYELLSSNSAFGIYSLNRYQDANYVNIGNEGILTGVALDFWKDKYYCKVYCLDSSETYQQDVILFGNKIASKIKGCGEEPPIIKRLSPNGLIPKSAKYFTRKLGLDNIHFVADENVFNLDGETKGIVAEYNINGNRYLSFIIEYPSAQKAELAFQSYIKYLSEKSKAINLSKLQPDKAKLFESDAKFYFVQINEQSLSGFWDVESLDIAKSILGG